MNRKFMKDIISKQINDSIEVKKLLTQDIYENTIENIKMAIGTAYKSDKKEILCGVVGSASDMLQIEGKFVGRFKMKWRAIIAIVSFPANVSSIDNENRNDNIFNRQVEVYGVVGDVY